MMVKKHGNKGVANVEKENSTRNFKGLTPIDVTIITIYTFYHSILNFEIRIKKWECNGINVMPILIF